MKELLERIEQVDCNVLEYQQLALTLVLYLERCHDEVVAEMNDDDEATHHQIISWSIDGVAERQ